MFFHSLQKKQKTERKPQKNTSKNTNKKSNKKKHKKNTHTRTHTQSFFFLKKKKEKEKKTDKTNKPKQSKTCPSWGVVVGPSFLGFGLALPSWSGFGPSFLVCGGWPFLLEFRVGPAFLGFGFWPFLLGVRAGPPFAGPSVFLMLVVGNSFLALGLAFPCWSGVGPSLLGCGGWPCLLGVCWPTTLGVGVGMSFFGWELVLSLWCGGVPSFLGVALVSSVVGAGPPFSGPSVFLMLVVGPCFSGLGFGLSLLEWGWPFLLRVWVGLSFFGWELVLSLWCGGFSLPSWGVSLLSSTVGVVPPFLVSVEVGPSWNGSWGGPAPTTEDKRATPKKEGTTPTP